MQQPSVTIKRKPGRPRKVVAYPTDLQTALAEVVEEIDVRPSLPVPEDWTLGALLNVRNNGAEYLVSLFPEEYDPRKPERTLRFTNYAECQNFVSAWYSRTWQA